jgi:hypothetical protein
VTRHGQAKLRVETPLLPTPNNRVPKPAAAANSILIMQISACLSPIHHSKKTTSPAFNAGNGSSSIHYRNFRAISAVEPES